MFMFVGPTNPSTLCSWTASWGAGSVYDYKNMVSWYFRPVSRTAFLMSGFQHKNPAPKLGIRRSRVASFYVTNTLHLCVPTVLSPPICPLVGMKSWTLRQTLIGSSSFWRWWHHGSCVMCHTTMRARAQWHLATFISRRWSSSFSASSKSDPPLNALRYFPVRVEDLHDCSTQQEVGACMILSTLPQ